MIFKINNCELVLQFSAHLSEPNFDRSLFRKVEDTYIYSNSAESKRALKGALKLLLPVTESGAKLILENVHISVIKQVGNLQLELRNSTGLIINFEGNLRLDVYDSVIRDVGSQGTLQGSLTTSQYIGVLGYEKVLLNANATLFDLDLMKNTEGIWDISGCQNKTFFNPENSSNLMIQSYFNDWVHAGSQPKVFINLRDENSFVGFSSNGDLSDEPEFLETAVDLALKNRLKKDLEAMEANDELIDLFDHYEKQLDLELDQSTGKDLKLADVIEVPDTSNQDEAQSSNKELGDQRMTQIQDQHIMQLYLKREISLEEMLSLLKSSGS